MNRRTSPVPRLYMSTAVSGDIAQSLGAQHYSYHFAAGYFRRMLERRGMPPVLLKMPECYASERVLPAAGGGRPVHLMFRSTAQIRLLKPAVNICCFAWEFPVLKTETLPGEHPFLNQARMLGLCDEVWTPSAFGERVLRAHGVDRVRHVPAPVPRAGARISRVRALAAIGGIDAVPLRVNYLWGRKHGAAVAGAAMAPLRDWLARFGRRPTVYLSICNPEDFRKNLDAMLRGFHRFRARHPGAVLIVKALTARSLYTLPELASDVVPNKLAAGSVIADDGILLINAYLSDAEMAALYSLADFYLCASIAEGQNLPLLEAMAQGTVAVSTRNTAMEDYVDEGCAYVVAGQAVRNECEHLAGVTAGRDFDISLCGARDVAAALERAHLSGRAEREAKARTGMAVVEAQFGEAEVWARVAGRLAAFDA